MQNNPGLALIFLTIVSLTGCDSNRIYEEAIDLKNRKWAFQEPGKFYIPVKDGSSLYNVNLYLRYTNNFSTSNLYFRYTLSDTTQLNKFEEEVKNVDLFDKKSGKPLGSSGIGDIYEIEVPLLQKYTFPDSGKYLMNVQQFMRKDTVSDIVSVGLRLEYYVEEQS